MADLPSDGWQPGQEGPRGEPSAATSRRRWAWVAGGVLVLAAAGGGVAGVLSGRGGHSAAPHASPAAVADDTTASTTPSETPTPSPSVSEPVSSGSPSPAADFAALYKDVSDGVVRIETVSCDGLGVGSGFLVGPDLVATVDHVVDGSVSIALKTDAGTTSGVVVGYDRQRDLALVRSARPLSGHTFSFAPGQPDVGTRVAAIGYPLGEPITMTQGGVSGLDRSYTLSDGTTRRGQIQTDTPVNFGNSGGPLLTADGSVVGLVDSLRQDASGIAWVVPSTDAAPLVSFWSQSPRVEPMATCDDPLGPQVLPDDVERVMVPPSAGDAAADVSDTLTRYFAGINSGDYASAYAMYSAHLRAGWSLAAFAADTATSFDSDFAVLDAATGEDTVSVTLQFTSLQAPDQGPDGDTCDRWTLRYRLVLDDGGAWRIDAADKVDGRTHTSC